MHSLALFEVALIGCGMGLQATAVNIFVAWKNPRRILSVRIWKHRGTEKTEEFSCLCVLCASVFQKMVTKNPGDTSANSPRRSRRTSPAPPGRDVDCCRIPEASASGYRRRPLPGRKAQLQNLRFELVFVVLRTDRCTRIGRNSIERPRRDLQCGRGASPTQFLAFIGRSQVSCSSLFLS